jgi:predicted O-methyltransferase YrrM
MNQLFEELKNIPNVNPELGALLYGLVFATRPKVVVELGTWYGYTAIWMAKAMDFWHQYKGVKYQPVLITVDDYKQPSMYTVSANFITHEVDNYIYNICGDASEQGDYYSGKPMNN